MELPRKKKLGRPKRMCMDTVKENIAVVELAEEAQKIGPNGDGKYEVSSLAGEKPKEEEDRGCESPTWEGVGACKHRFPQKLSFWTIGIQ